MSKPTIQDAELVLKIYDLRREEVMRRARKWFMSEFSAKTLADFKAQCPSGSDANAYYRQVVSFWEMIAGIVLQGAVNEDLLFASGAEDVAVWMTIQPFIADLRAERQNPIYLSQLEALAKRHLAWREHRLAEHAATAAAAGAKPKVRRAGRAARAVAKPPAKRSPRRRPAR